LEQQIKECSEALLNGALVLLGSRNTNYIACAACNDQAVLALQKKAFAGFATDILLADPIWLRDYCATPPIDIEETIDAYEGSTLHLALPNLLHISDRLMAQDGFTNVSFTRDKFVYAVLKRMREPIAIAQLPRTEKEYYSGGDAVEFVADELHIHPAQYLRWNATTSNFDTLIN
jgi:hypothetical protein